MEKKVRIRIYDTKNRHLEDIDLPPKDAVYLSPGGYLSDYQWAEKLKISYPDVRKIHSVGTHLPASSSPGERKTHQIGGREASRDRQPEGLPFLSIWVDDYEQKTSHDDVSSGHNF